MKLSDLRALLGRVQTAIDRGEALTLDEGTVIKGPRLRKLEMQLRDVVTTIAGKPRDTSLGDLFRCVCGNPLSSHRTVAGRRVCERCADYFENGRRRAVAP